MEFSFIIFMFCRGQIFSCLRILVLSLPDLLFLFFWPIAPIYYSSWSCIFVVVYLSENSFLGGRWYMWTFAKNLQSFLKQSQSHLVHAFLMTLPGAPHAFSMSFSSLQLYFHQPEKFAGLSYFSFNNFFIAVAANSLNLLFSYRAWNICWELAIILLTVSISFSFIPYFSPSTCHAKNFLYCTSPPYDKLSWWISNSSIVLSSFISQGTIVFRFLPACTNVFYLNSRSLLLFYILFNSQGTFAR